MKSGDLEVFVPANSVWLFNGKGNDSRINAFLSDTIHLFNDELADCIDAFLGSVFISRLGRDFTAKRGENDFYIPVICCEAKSGNVIMNYDIAPVWFTYFERIS